MTETVVAEAPSARSAEREWPAFSVERREIGKLKPSNRNARLHTEAQIEQIVGSIREWGWTQPILVDARGGIIAGHGRYEAAKRLGAAEVPVIVARGWSAAQKRAYMLADNQIGLNAEWDRNLLVIEIGGLMKDGFDLNLAGFGDIQLTELLDGTEFAPNLSPETDARVITGADVTAAADGLAEGFAERGAAQDIISVVCPHCNQTLRLSRAALG